MMQHPDIDDADIRLLDQAPEPTRSIAPPHPRWLNTLANWRSFAALDRTPPALADSPPPGRPVADNDARLRYHALMPTVLTPAVSTTLLTVHQQLLANRERTHGKVGVIIEGPRGTGKSTILQYVGRYYENKIARLYEPDQGRIPVIALRVPAAGRGGHRNWPAAFASFLGLPRDGGSDPTRAICHTLRAAKTLLVLIDGIEQLRPGTDTEDSFAYLEEIGETTGATFLYTGRSARAIVDPATRDRETPLDEHEDPWGDHPTLRTSRIGYDDDSKKLFARIVREFDKNLRLRHHQADDLTRLHPYLHQRSKGYLRALSHLIGQAAQQAILTGEERLTHDLLDTLPLGRSLHL